MLLDRCGFFSFVSHNGGTQDASLLTAGVGAEETLAAVVVVAVLLVALLFGLLVVVLLLSVRLCVWL